MAAVSTFFAPSLLSDSSLRVVAIEAGHGMAASGVGTRGAVARLRRGVLAAMMLLCAVRCPDAAAADALVLDAAQISALGIRFMPLPAVSASPQIAAPAVVTVPPSHQYVVAAPFGARVTQTLVGAGDTVSPGQPLARLVSAQVADARRALVEARSQAGLAEDALRRDRQLSDEGIVPLARLRASEARAAQARAMVAAREAELQAGGLTAGPAAASSASSTQGLADAVLYAPMAGMVAQAAALPGQRVEAGALLFTIIDTSQLWLEVRLSAQQAARLSVGGRVTIASRQAEGSIIAVPAIVDASQAVLVRVRIDKVGDLRTGEIVTAQLALADGSAGIAGQPDAGTRRSARRVPVAAVVTLARTPPAGAAPAADAAIDPVTGPAVFVADPKGARSLPVTVLSSDDDTALVVADWPPDARVAVTGVAALKAMLQSSP